MNTEYAFGRSSVLLVISVMFFLCSFTACSTKKNEPVESQDFYMGTIISQKAYGQNAEKAVKEVRDRIQEIEKKMTINEPGSETDKLNDAAGKSEVSLSPDVIHVLSTAKKFASISNGSFDVTVGPLVKAWGIFTNHQRIPSMEEIMKLKKLVDYKDLRIDEKHNTAQLTREGQIADLGGIAKGYAGDEAIRIYKENKIESAYVNLGGNVVVLGKKPDSTLWKIGVQNPRGENGEILGIIELENKAVVSSGDYERFFVRDNKRYHHILDPKTGYPAESDLIGTTIVADSSTEADALSTATFVLGLDKGMELIESIKGVDAIFITKGKKIYSTSGLKDKFVLKKGNKEFTYVKKG